MVKNYFQERKRLANSTLADTMEIYKKIFRKKKYDVKGNSNLYKRIKSAKDIE